MDDNSPPRRRPRKVTDEEVLAALAASPNMRQLLSSLGIAVYGGNYGSMRRRLERLGVLPDRMLPIRSRRHSLCFSATDQALADAVARSLTKADVLRALGYEPRPSMYPQLNKALHRAGISTEHFRGRAWSRGRRDLPGKPLDMLLTRGSTAGSNTLRLRLLRDGVFEHRCACCGRTAWNGRPIPLELDHIDGDRTNNDLANLRLLCPNCHAQTDTYRGRNIGRPHGSADALRFEPEALLLARARRRLTSIVGAA